MVRAGDDAVIDVGGLDRLIVLLGERGYRAIGPVARDGAIVHGEVSGADDLPAGWHDVQAPGRYRLEQAGDAELFGWAVGPASWKSEFFKPTETLWRATVSDAAVSIRLPPPPERPLAIVGARPCELAALDVLDRVLAGGEVPDDRYTARRAGSLVVAVECGKPSSTCFCTSMGTGPDAGPGYDLALTELLTGTHRFYVQVGSEAGADLLDGIGWTPATEEDRGARREVVDGARAGMGRSLQTDGLAALLARNLEHPRWDEVAERCLSCGNLHPGLPDLLLRRREGRERGRRHDRAPAVVGLVLRRRPLLPPRWVHPAHHLVALPPVAHPQAVDVVGPVRHVRLRRLRALYRLVPRRHRHHRGGGRHPGERRCGR